VAQAHVFVDDLDAPVVGPDDRHHLERVLRLRVGEAVSASDGRGGFRACTFAGEGGRLEPAGEVERTPALSPVLAVGFALVKGEKPEWIVQKLTECGVDRILPFVAERSVVRWDEAKAARNAERLQRVAVEAAMQSRRVWLPSVAPVRPFAAVVAEGGDGVVLADADGGPLSLSLSVDGSPPVVLVGPEGGWSAGERAAARGRFVRFGPTILRAETAAVAAGVLLSALRAGAVRPADGRGPRS
jgi:16S rRNA (uracil1498-N3)-methyltransferase